MLCLKSLFSDPATAPKFASPIPAQPSKCHFWGFPINSRCSRAGLVAQWRCLELAGSQEPLSYFLFFNTPTAVYSVPTAGQAAVHLGDLQGHPLCQEGGHQPSPKPEAALEWDRFPHCQFTAGMSGVLPQLHSRGKSWAPHPRMLGLFAQGVLSGEKRISPPVFLSPWRLRERGISPGH